MMKLKKLESFPAGNPFLFDRVSMGIKVANNLMIMMMNHPDAELNGAYLVNPGTGERHALVVKEEKR